MEKQPASKIWKLKDKVLIRYIAAGMPPLSEQAKETLYARYCEKFTRIYAAKGLSKEEAHDMTIEGLFASFEHISNGKFQGRSKYKTFLDGILKKMYANLLRQKSTLKAGKGREMSLEEIQAERNFDATSLAPSPFQLFQNKELKEMIKSLMKDAETCMKIFNWIWEGYSYKEIVGKSEDKRLSTEKAVKQRSYRCRKHLKEKILKECPELVPQFIRRKEALHGVL